MNCPACGQPLSDGAALCPHCGHDNSAELPSAEGPAEPQPAEGPPPQPIDLRPPNPDLICPRCGHRLLQPVGYCPNCGAMMNPGGQWPPPAQGAGLGPMPPPTSLGSLVAGFFGGFALALFGSIFAGLGLVIASLFYFFFRDSRPSFARGWGFGILTAIAFVLGLFAICTWQFMSHPGV